jgi:hypothetical protein
MGIGTSRVINHSRTLTQQIYRDAQHLVAPNPATIGNADGGGVLIIINHAVDSEMLDTRLGGIHDPVTDFRSDQLLFFYDNRASPLEPLTPANTSSFANSSNAPYARIWYGHVEPTAADGLSSSGLGRFANDWVLGRHALLLDEELPVSPVHANGVHESAPVTFYTAIPVANREMRWALTDVAYYSFNNPNSNAYAAALDSVFGGPGINRQIVGAAGANTFLENYEGGLGMDFATYRDRALRLPFATDRMRTNPIPDGADYESWRIAQGHTYMMSGVSEFIVEFAGDYNPVDGEIDADDGPGGSGDTIWYGHYNRNTGGIHNMPFVNEPPVPPFAIATGSEPNPAYVTIGGSGAFIFRHDDTTYWPRLIRIRYRLHDADGVLAGQNEFRRNDGLDNDGDGTNDNVEESEEAGKWFEMIIPVNRS